MIQKKMAYYMVFAMLGLGFGGAACSSSKASSGPTADGGGGGGSTGCAAYCTTIMKNCTGGDGTNGKPTLQQYTSNENCLAACTAFPVGTQADQSKNTLGCRSNHATLAGADATAAALHCPHAGPSGDGTCGTACDGYCQLVAKFCTGASKIYADDAACHARCAATADDERFNIGIQDGNHVACLLYHAQEAPLAPADHCVGDLTPADAGVSFGSVTCQ
jgi:hypothetical protein